VRVAAVLPALDEERALPSVLAGLRAGPLDRIVVVDNGSRDLTAAVAREGGATVVTEPQRGYGAACLAGISHLAAHDPPDVLVIVDADCSDDLARIPDLLAPIRDGSADLVLSSRTMLADRGSLAPVQRLGNALQVNLLRLRFGIRLTDMGPMRAIRFPALLALSMEDRTWGWNVEMACKACKASLRIVEVPVGYRPRIGTSKISGNLRGAARASGKILWAFARYAR
jgi:glycosyltransferase involved in cell wall biosynthesis